MVVFLAPVFKFLQWLSFMPWLSSVMYCGFKKCKPNKIFFFLESLLATVTANWGRNWYQTPIVAIVVTDVAMLFGKIVKVLGTLGWKSVT